MPNDTNQVQRILNDPNFYSLPPGERTKVLAQLDPNFAALPANEQLTVVSRGVQPSSGASQSPAPQRSFLQRAYDAMTWTPPHWPKQGYSEVPEGSGFTGVSNAAGEVSQDLQDAANKQQTQNLTQAATGQQPGFGARTKRALLQTGADTTRMISGATSPANQAIALGTIAAPEIAAPLFIGHGLYTGLSNAPDALKGNPDAAERSLGGFSEAASGGALGKGIIDNPSLTGFARARPTPDMPPGLSADATANLSDKSARLGTNDVFRAASPSSANPGFRERLSIAAPDLAEMQRRTPLQTSGGILNPDFRIREFTTNANSYLDDLWNNQRQPQIDRNAAAVRSLDPIKQSIIESVSDLDRENYPGAAQEVARKVNAMPDYESLGQLSDRLREVNAQRSAYRGMTPQEQAAANITAPKIDAINAEYDSLQQAISDELTNRGEQGVQDFDKRYSALSGVRDELQSQQNPAETTRLLDQIKAWVSPTGAAGVHQRIPMVASPGRTLESGLKRLASSALAPPAAAAPNPPPIAGLLPPPPPILASPPDTSGPVAAADRTQPLVWTADMRNQVARQTPAPPPPVPPQFARESVLPNQSQAIGRAGDDAIQVNTLPTEFSGEGYYKGLLPGPPAPFVPPPPPPPMPQVGGLPPLESSTGPSPMWDGTASPGSGNVPVNQPGQTAALRGGVVQATAPPMNPPPPFPPMMPDMWDGPFQAPYDPFAANPFTTPGAGPRPPLGPPQFPPVPRK
jgi:hypothetical protein